MIEIKNQAQLNAILSSTPADKLIRIYPEESIGEYRLSAAWSLPTKAHIEGVQFPKIVFTGNPASGVNTELLTVLNVNNVRIRGLHLIGRKDVAGTINGISVDGVGTAPNTGLETGTNRYDSTTAGGTINNVLGVLIDNCIIEGFKGYGVSIQNGKHVTVRNTKVKNNSYSGILLEDVRQGKVVGCEAHANGYDGIELKRAYAGIVRNCKSSGNTYDGIYFETARHCTAYGNTLVDNGANGIQATTTSENVVVAKNIMDDNSGRGILLAGAIRSVVSDNAVSGNSLAGIRMDSSHYSTVSGNSVGSNTQDGIHLLGSTSIALSGNTMNDNGAWGLLIDAASLRCAALGNTLKGNTSGNISDAGGNAISTTGRNKIV